MKFFLYSFLLLYTIHLSAQSLPTGFQDERLNVYKRDNSGITFDKNGRGYLWRMTGQVHILDTTRQLLPIPMIDISPEVAKWHDQGMAGFALHPDFPSTPYIYLLYVVDRHHYFNFGTADYNPNTETTHQASIGRITRYTADSATDFTTVIPASRKVLLGKTFADGFPILFNSHGLSVLAFGEDGTLLAACGDGASSISADIGSNGDTFYQQALEDGIIRPEENIGAYRSQLLGSLAGKLIRIDAETGDGLSSNPFYDANAPQSAASRIWAMGLRNPFRFTVKPNSGVEDASLGHPGTIYLGDVGNNSWEEINVINDGGLNLGWPLYEGYAASIDYAHFILPNPEAPNPLFDSNECEQEFYTFHDLIQEDNLEQLINIEHPCIENTTIMDAPTFLHQRPVMAYRNEARDSLPTAFTPSFDAAGKATIIELETPDSPVKGQKFQGIASMGGVFYQGDNFPSAYQNAYFHLDYDGWIRAFQLDDSDQLIQVDTFFAGGEKLTAVAVNPKDGCIYYVSYPYGLRRICYGENLPPSAVIDATQTFGASPLSVQFDARRSMDTDLPLTYLWDFGDGQQSTEMTPHYTFINPSNIPQSIEVILTVTDALGAISTAQQLISLDNTPPQVEITNLKEGDRFPTDASHLTPLFLRVSDQEHAENELTYHWETYLHHNTHFHPIRDFSTKNAHLITTPVGCDGTPYWYRIVAKVTDAVGLSASDEINIYPNCNNDFIQLKQLTSYATSTQIELKWETQRESDVEQLIIERSSDGYDFTEIGIVSAKGSNATYTFSDVAPLTGDNLYRIRAVASNRDYLYSNVSIATFPPPQNIYFYPNPMAHFLQIEVLKPYTNQLKLDMYDAAGALIGQYHFLTPLEQYFSKQLNVSHWANGVYFYRLENGREVIRGSLIVLK